MPITLLDRTTAEAREIILLKAREKIEAGQTRTERVLGHELGKPWHSMDVSWPLGAWTISLTQLTTSQSTRLEVQQERYIWD